MEQCIKKIGGAKFDCVHWKEEGSNFQEVLTFLGKNGSYDAVKNAIFADTVSGRVTATGGGHVFMRDGCGNLYVLDDKTYRKGYEKAKGKVSVVDEAEKQKEKEAADKKRLMDKFTSKG